LRNPEHAVLRRTWLDWLFAAGLFAGSFLVYLHTLAPSVATIFDDSLEFQLVCYLPGIAHPTGYPLYTLLGKLFTYLPLGDVAYRVNLMSAFFASLTASILYATLILLIGHRVPALLGAATFALSPVFWSQAVIAEVYTLHAAFVAAAVCLLLAWSRSSQMDRAERGGPLQNPATLLSLLALVCGLSLTHHRTMLLLAPAALLYVALVDRRVFTNRRLLARLALLIVAPLALYLYLPLRGMTMSSLDGVYENTLSGFLSYVAAGPYGIFLRENPLAQSRDLAFYALLLHDQFTWAGMILAAVGLAYSFTRRREALLLLIFALTTALFALGYLVPDIQVFLIPLFLVCSLWIGMGLAALWELILALLRAVKRQESATLRHGLYLGLFIGGSFLPLYLWQVNRDQVDLSSRWEVYDCGVDMLSQPLDDDAVVVSLLGEKTLLNYFQATQGLRPHLVTIFADAEDERLARVRAEMESGHPVYLTRPLSGVGELYHLSSLGPLIRVSERPAPLLSEPSHPLAVPFGEAIVLIGYDAELRDTHNGQQLRVTLHWESRDETPEDYKISLRLLDDEGHLGASHDAFPVLDAYRTNSWREGEVIVDTHDLPILAGLPANNYTLQLTMYDPDTLAPLGTATLGSVALGPTLSLKEAGLWDVESKVEQNLGGQVILLGYSIIGRDFKPGETIPITFLWQGLESPSDDYTLLLWLENGSGVETGEQRSHLSERYPPAMWQRGEIVRDWESFLVPGNTEDGGYHLKVQLQADGQALPRLLYLLPAGSVIDLGEIEVRGRERSFDVPSMDHDVGLRLGDSVKLLGYNLGPGKLGAGGTLSLTLYWQGAGTTDTPYTVFVHLLDEQDNILAQQDSVPGQGTLPTTSWLEGEVITDPHEVPMPSDVTAGTYTIIVGMYDASTAQRLPVFDAGGHLLGDHVKLSEVTLAPE
jgi:hypothetical protein